MDKPITVCPENLRLKQDNSLVTDVIVNPITNRAVFCPRGQRLSQYELEQLFGETSETQLNRGVAVIIPKVDLNSVSFEDEDPDDHLEEPHWTYSNQHTSILASITGNPDLSMATLVKVLNTPDTQLQFYPEGYFCEYIEP